MEIELRSLHLEYDARADRFRIQIMTRGDEKFEFLLTSLDKFSLEQMLRVAKATPGWSSELLPG